MFNRKSRPLIVAVVLFGVVVQSWALIRVGGSKPVQNQDWPDGSEKVANVSARFAYWEGPPFGGGNFHFEYTGETPQFQETLDKFAKVKAPRLELVAVDGATTSTFSERAVHWEFEIWSRKNYETAKRFSGSPWYGKPLPPPRLTIFISADNPVDFKKIRVPPAVMLIDRRAIRPSAVRPVVRDNATTRPLSFR